MWKPCLPGDRPEMFPVTVIIPSGAFVIGFDELDQTAWSDDTNAKEEDNFGQNKLQCFDTHVVDVSGTEHPIQLFGT